MKQELDAVNQVKMSASLIEEKVDTSSRKGVRDTDIPSTEMLKRAMKTVKVTEVKMSPPFIKQELDAVNQVKMSASLIKEKLDSLSKKEVHDAEFLRIPSIEVPERAMKTIKVTELKMSPPFIKQELDAVNHVKMSTSLIKEKLDASSRKEVLDTEFQHIPSGEVPERAISAFKGLQDHSYKAVVRLEEGEFTSALREAMKCLVNSYTLKGTAELKLGLYQKALTTFQEGLQYDKDNEELMDGFRAAEALKEREELQAKVELNPTCTAIISDPIMLQILIDRHENSNVVQQGETLPMKEILQKLEEDGLLDDLWY